MGHFFRLSLACGFIAAAILIIALGLARNNAYLIAPAHLILFAAGLALYLLPAAMAWRRNCQAWLQIALVDVLLGWTVVGWAAAMYWAATGRVRTPTPPAVPAHA
jgi:Superinfection immunity protein